MNTTIGRADQHSPLRQITPNTLALLELIVFKDDGEAKVVGDLQKWFLCHVMLQSSRMYSSSFVIHFILHRTDYLTMGQLILIIRTWKQHGRRPSLGTMCCETRVSTMQNESNNKGRSRCRSVRLNYWKKAVCRVKRRISTILRCGLSFHPDIFHRLKSGGLRFLSLSLFQ